MGIRKPRIPWKKIVNEDIRHFSRNYAHAAFSPVMVEKIEFYSILDVLFKTGKLTQTNKALAFRTAVNLRQYLQTANEQYLGRYEVCKARLAKRCPKFNALLDMFAEKNVDEFRKRRQEKVLEN